MSAQPVFSYRRENGPRFVAERADGVMIAWIKEHHEDPLANLWSYRDGEIEAIFFGDVDIAFVSVGADGLPRNDDDIRVTFRLPRASFFRQGGPPPSPEQLDAICRNVVDAFRTWPEIWDPVPRLRLNDVVLV